MLSWGTYHRERPNVEADLTVRATEALRAAGQPWAKVAVSGRDAVITGRAQQDGEPKAALDIVRGVWGIRTVQLKTDLAGAAAGPERIGPALPAADDAPLAAAKVNEDADAAEAVKAKEADEAAAQKAKEEAEAAAAQKAKDEAEAAARRAEAEAAAAKAKEEEEAEAAAALKAKDDAEAAELKAKEEAEAAAAQRAKEQTEAAIKAQAEAEARLKAEEDAEAAALKAKDEAEAAAALKAKEDAEAAEAARRAKEEAEAAAKKAEEEAAAARAEAEAAAAQKAKQEADMAAEAKADAEAQAAAEAAAKKAADEEAKRAQRKTTTETKACEKELGEAVTEDVILFDRASADIDGKSDRTVRKLAAIIRKCPGARVEVEGHTDSEGTDERNQSLSERRARAVVKSLVKAGVAEDRLSAVGYGASRPAQSNKTKAGMAQNRRIEFKVFME